MSEQDKLMAFGKYLVERREQHKHELFMMSISARHPEAAIRVKAGHVESVSSILEAFSRLYNSSVEEFAESYLNGAKKQGEEEESDGAS